MVLNFENKASVKIKLGELVRFDFKKTSRSVQKFRSLLSLIKDETLRLRTHVH